MITFVLVAVLGILLAMTLKNLFQKSEPAAKKQIESFADLKITDARVGDNLSIAGAGDEMTDLDFTVDRRTEYEAGSKRWFELSGMYKDRRIHLDVMDDEELEVDATLHPSKLTLEDLGVTEDDMAQMDERQNTSDSFEFDGKVWNYRFSREIAVRREGQMESTGYYMWEFREDGGNRLLTLRKGEREPFSASVSTKIHPGDITVYRGS